MGLQSKVGLSICLSIFTIYSCKTIPLFKADISMHLTLFNIGGRIVVSWSLFPLISLQTPIITKWPTTTCSGHLNDKALHKSVRACHSVKRYSLFKGPSMSVDLLQGRIFLNHSDRINYQGDGAEKSFWSVFFCDFPYWPKDSCIVIYLLRRSAKFSFSLAAVCFAVCYVKCTISVFNSDGLSIRIMM